MRHNRVSWHAGKRGRSGSWRFSKVIDGKRKFFYAPAAIGKKDRRQAERWMHSVLIGLEVGTVDLPKITVAELGSRWIEWMAARVPRDLTSPRSLQSRSSEVKSISTQIGRRVASTLMPSDVDSLASSWSHLAPTTFRNRIIALKTMLKWGVKRSLISVDPLAAQDVPPLPVSGDKYVPQHETMAFIDWLDRRARRATGTAAKFARSFALLFRFVAETGCRPIEAAFLRWEYWRPDEGAFIFEKHKTARKTRKLRMIVVSREMASILEKLRTGVDGDPEWVFVKPLYRKQGSMVLTPETRQRGWHWTSGTLCNRIREIRIEAARDGIPVSKEFTLYKLRHASITAKIQEGMNINDVAALSGNSAKVIERTYLHVQLKHLRGVIDGAA